MHRLPGFIGGALGDASITFCALGLGLAYARVIPGLAGFGLFALGSLIGVVATLFGVVLLYRSGVSVGSVMAMFGAVPAAFLLYSLIDGRDIPAINDISTDVDFPPAFEEALEEPANSGRDMEFPAAFKSVVRESYPAIKPLGLQRTVDTVFAQAMEQANAQQGWEITATRITPDSSEFEGHATSRVFGFVDDFVVRITNVEGGCVVNMRSKSRDGKSDLGANAARIENFLADLTSP